MEQNKLLPTLTALLGLLALSACREAAPNLPQAGISNRTPLETLTEASGLTDSADREEPEYQVVFPQNRVNEILITISPENWQAMMDDLTELLGEAGTGQGNRAGGRPAGPPPGQDRPTVPDGQQPPGDFQGRPPGQGNPAALGGADDQNPIWAEAEIVFEGSSWEHVGIRFKGNSSLRSSWGAGSLKLPFKLDFDQFEDDYPETEDQRFFGFKQLSFSSNFHDDSFLHEKVAADLFRESGVPSAQTAFYAVTLDYGEGEVYLGLYTAVEVVDDTLIETQFKFDQGNVYKPEGAGATFAEGSFSEASFDKETNQEQNDYDDILALYEALHADSRVSDPERWRADLEAVFDVDGFLNWLAVNTVIQNWDTYGVMNHNYYLYNDPDSGQLVWIPWDNNEALKSGGGMRNSLPLDLGGVGEEWPLISYLRDDPVYYQAYLSYLEAFISGIFLPEEMAGRYQDFHELIAPYVAAELEGGSSLAAAAGFSQSVSDLIQHTRTRVQLTEDFLAQ